MCTDCLDRWGKVSNFAAQEKSEKKSTRKKRKRKAKKRRERMRKKRERRKRKKKRKKRDKKKEREKENIEERKRKKLKKYGEVDKRAVRSVAYWAYASRQCVQRFAVVAVGKGTGGLVAVAYRRYRPAAVAA